MKSAYSPNFPIMIKIDKKEFSPKTINLIMSTIKKDSKNDKYLGAPFKKIEKKP